MTTDENNTTTHSLVATLHHRPGALDRLFGLLRRHGCQLTDLTLIPADQPSCDEVRLRFHGGHASRFAQQARRLVDVVQVHENDPREL
jgi:acetolactate synthase small subunit